MRAAIAFAQSTTLLASGLALAAMVYAHPEQLVDSAWVAVHGSDPDVRVLDLQQRIARHRVGRDLDGVDAPARYGVHACSILP